MRHLTGLDNIISEIDTTLRTLFIPENRTPARETPGNNYPEVEMSTQEKQHVAGLMRVNHSGEVCAQALYQGQAMTASLHHVRQQMAEAAEEEVDHLAWCEQRLNELGSQPSIFNPFWYMSSIMLGMLAGFAGDKWSLGFVAETERQVTAHLENHLKNIPAEDKRTNAILEQMKDDETQHAESAHNAGAAELPWVVKKVMTGVSQLMTRSSYYI